MDLPPTDWQKKHHARLRVMEALLEIGTLLVTFTPLDGVLQHRDLGNTWPMLTVLFLAGVLLILLGIRGERRIYDSE